MKARLLLVVLLVGLAVALLATSWSSRRSVLRAGDVLALGQGEALVETAHRHLMGMPPEDMAARLTEILEDERPAGLRFIGLLGPDVSVIGAAGDAAGPWPPDHPTMPGSPEHFGARVRLAIGGGPPPRPDGHRGASLDAWHGGPRPDDGAGMTRAGLSAGASDASFDGARPGAPDAEAMRAGAPPRPDGAPRASQPPDSAGAAPGGLPRDASRPEAGGPPRERGGRRPPPLLVIEFEPLVATDLERVATRTFVVGAATSLALVASALLLWRLLVHQERAERRHADQRRLAALGEMSAVLAHEIRNPLASLKGHAQLLAERLDATSVEGRGAERVVSEAKRLERLASSLLDFVRTARVERGQVDPASLLRECAEESAPGRVDVDAHAAPPTWPLDALRMRQVLRNVLDNAVHASPSAARVDARVALEGGRLVFEVRDRGEGLPPGDVEQLFAPFRTTRTTGTGLGLAVARRIVELHGGTITAANHSGPGGGAVFRVEIPDASGMP